MTYLTRLEALNACGPALDWLRSNRFPTLQAAWDVCPRGDWMLWLLQEYPPAKEVSVRLAVAFARSIPRPYPAALAAIEAAERWLAAPSGENRLAATYAADTDADAATYAANAAAYAAAYAASSANAARKKQADIVRSIVPTAPNINPETKP